MSSNQATPKCEREQFRQISLSLFTKCFVDVYETFHIIFSYIIGQFAFGHAETLGPLYTALGLFNDSTPLRADNFKEHEDRLFRSSLILPFGANLQLILYECEPQDLKANEDDDAEHHPEYFVKLLVNEEPQLLPGCDEFLCPYSIIRDKYKAQVENCNFSQICKWHPKDELWCLQCESFHGLFEKALC